MLNTVLRGLERKISSQREEIGTFSGKSPLLRAESHQPADNLSVNRAW